MLDLIVLIYNEIDTRRFQKTQEDSTPKRGGERLPSGQAAQPLGPNVSLHITMLVLHRLLG